MPDGSLGSADHHAGTATLELQGSHLQSVDINVERADADKLRQAPDDVYLGVVMHLDLLLGLGGRVLLLPEFSAE